jgi:hypothetical protein
VRALAPTLALLVACAIARAEVPNLTPEQLDEVATIVVEGTLDSIGGLRERSIAWDRRRWIHRLRVEQVLRGEGIAAGDLLEVHAWSSFYRFPVMVPAYATGHRPLPLVGERARLYAKRRDDGRIAAVLPNGWSIPGIADRRERRRFDPGPLQDPAAAMAWLVLALGLGSTALSIRRKGRTKFALLSLGAAMLLYGFWMTL